MARATIGWRNRNTPGRSVTVMIFAAINSSKAENATSRCCAAAATTNSMSNGSPITLATMARFWAGSDLSCKSLTITLTTESVPAIDENGAASVGAFREEAAASSVK